MVACIAIMANPISRLSRNEAAVNQNHAAVRAAQRRQQPVAGAKFNRRLNPGGEFIKEADRYAHMAVFVGLRTDLRPTVGARGSHGSSMHPPPAAFNECTF